MRMVYICVVMLWPEFYIGQLDLSIGVKTLKQTVARFGIRILGRHITGVNLNAVSGNK
jgi:hypothetical protein